MAVREYDKTLASSDWHARNAAGSVRTKAGKGERPIPRVKGSVHLDKSPGHTWADTEDEARKVNWGQMVESLEAEGKSVGLCPRGAARDFQPTSLAQSACPQNGADLREERRETGAKWSS